MINLLKFSALFSVAFLFISCESLTEYLVKSPQLDLNEVKLESVSLSGMTFTAVFKADNPNNADLNIDEINYEMFIGDKSLFTGVSKKPLTLKAKGQTSVELPIAIKFSEAKDAFEQIITRQKNDYTFKGTSKIGLFSLPFNKKGEFEIPAMSF